MTDLGADRYELYRVITDMDALHEGFRDRVEELQATREGLDEAGQLQSGYSGKLLCNPPMKSFGRQSLPGMLKATGMALILVIDDDRFALIKEQLGRRKRPMRSIVRIKRPKWLFNSKTSLKMQGLRNLKLSPQQRRRIAKKAAKARWQLVKAKQLAAVAALQEIAI